MNKSSLAVGDLVRINVEDYTGLGLIISKSKQNIDRYYSFHILIDKTIEC